MNTWQAQLFRFSLLFPNTQKTQFDPNDWWQEVIGEPPDAISSQPKIGRFAGESVYGSGKLVLKTQQDRIDWVYLVSESDNPAKLDTLGDSSQALDIFLSVLRKWMALSTIPDARRVAYGCIFISPVENKQHAYAHLNTMLPSITLDEEDSSDFMYQINRPRIVSNDSIELKINRLSKWGAKSDIEQNIAFSDTGPQQTTIVHNVYSHLEMDINTAMPEASSPNPITAQGLPAIFDTLVQMGKEIAKDGDIA